MATKTFKIGLSTSDKSAMAQDVYERLIAMCFDEYDSTKVYNEGDFVVYENPADTFKLYKCKEDNVTGTWNSAKWELATFQDLVDDVEGAVASVDGKANVDGNYPTMTVGLADNLTPYDEESGDDQDEPFSFQATGTANGTQADFATGSNALLREKQGHTLVVNQLARELTNAYYSTNNATATFDNGVATFTATAQNGRLYRNSRTKLIENHRYLMIVDLKLTTATDKVKIDISDTFTQFASSTTNKQRVMLLTSVIGPVTAAGEQYLRVVDTRTSDWDAIVVYQIAFIDLYQWFNGDIPQDLLDHPENFFHYYNGDLSYNTGTLVNANSQYIKCIGRNQFDGELEGGGYSSTTGEKDDNNGQAFRTKNYVRVVPGSTICVHTNSTLSPSGYYICEYDNQNNFIKRDSSYSNNFTVNLSPNCSYITAYFYKDNSGWKANPPSQDTAQIVLSIYYSGESGYDQYYPYEVLTNTDTGTETLRQAGSVKDYKTSDGVVHENVGVLDCSTLTESDIGIIVQTSSRLAFFISTLPIGTFAVGLNNVKSNITTNKFTTATPDAMYANTAGDLTIAFQGGRSFYLRDDANFSLETATKAQILASLANTIIYYAKATPTTEQGTTFSPNLVIDDFGSMEFSGTSGVPQGNLIFYPVDYKAFVDTLYNYTEGTPSNIALKSDLSASESARDIVDTQLQNAIGGTLRQCLCVKENLDFDNTAFVDMGTRNWMYRSADGVFTLNNDFLADAPNTTFKILCTKYQTNNVSAGNMSDKQISARPNYNNKDITVKDSAYTDATAFKAAMKGVLLAYEKGE